jgi:glycosyltransferase involved in cell wall biosynthesis
VILPFRDHEEQIGTAVTRVAAYLRQTEWSFEIVAVDDDSRDNSQAVLALIRAAHPELRVISAPARGRGHCTGAGAARGQILWFIEPREALAPLAGFASAYVQMMCRERHVIDRNNFVVADRARCGHVVGGIRGYGAVFRHRLLERMTDRVANSRRRAPRWAARLVSVLSLARISPPRLLW